MRSAGTSSFEDLRAQGWSGRSPCEPQRIHAAPCPRLPGCPKQNSQRLSLKARHAHGVHVSSFCLKPVHTGQQGRSGRSPSLRGPHTNSPSAWIRRFASTAALQNMQARWPAKGKTQGTWCMTGPSACSCIQRLPRINARAIGHKQLGAAACKRVGALNIATPAPAYQPRHLPGLDLLALDRMDCVCSFSCGLGGS